MNNRKSLIVSAALVIVLIFSIRILPVAAAGAECERSPRQWCPAQIRGLRMGTATVGDVQRVLGRPESVERDTDQRFPASYFYPAPEYRGRLEVWIDSRGVAHEAVIYPEHMSRDEVIRRFGPGYVLTRYDFDMCLYDGESGPVFESPTGMIRMLEYRSKGVAVSLNYRDEVNQIEFRSTPYGAATSQCPKKEDSTRVARVR